MLDFKGILRIRVRAVEVRILKWTCDQTRKYVIQSNDMLVDTNVALVKVV